ncbi:transposable element Tcb2 transposase [Trichonephila clavipes]|nr:transposable element Tcb2 transposase [Trichonephila clavipes]
MPPQRNKEKFQQRTEFKRVRIIVLREGGFSYRAIGARVQRNSFKVMRVWKQWTDNHRTTRKTGSGRRKAVGSTLVTATGVLMSASSIRRRLLRRGLCARVPLYRIPLSANHRRLRLQWAHEHRAWRADWHQAVFSDESCFNLWDRDGCIRVRRSAGERCLPQCVITRHRGLTPGVMVWGAILYHGRSNLLRIESIPGAIFQQNNERPHVAKTVRDLWDSVGLHLACVPRPAASTDELLLRIQAV